MNISRRFFLLNALTVLVAILVTALAAVVFGALYAGVFHQQAGIADLNKVIMVKAGFKEIKGKILATDSESFRANYQDALFSSVRALGAEAIVLQNRDVVYATAKFRQIDIEKCLTLSNTAYDNETLELDGKPYLFERINLKMKSGESAVVLLLAPLKVNLYFFQYLMLFAVIFFIISFLVMNLWVSITFSRKVIHPVTRLNEAASRISAGDLQYEIAEEGEGEVKELSRTLEQMRLKLKESVYLQGKYDENRKFLISSISHDLKTPVTSIKGYIEGIMDGIAKTPEKMQNYLETARTKAILVNSMIDDLLLYSRLDMNQIPFHFERTDLLQYFEYCVADYIHEFEKAGIQLSLKNELKEAAHVVMDKERMKRVVQNILDNAKKYMTRTDGQIAVILRETRTSAIVEMKDNGKGISEEALPRIFDRFYRADASRKNTDGSGLGLAIAKQIVEGHEGRIWAVSKENEGTSIILSLKKE